MLYDELVKDLREEAEWAEANEWETPIMLSDHLKQAADAIEELICEVADEHNARLDAEERQRWIPVTGRLPRDRQFVLVYCGDNKRIRPSDRFDVAILLGDSIFTSLGVTHWMPLPEPPKGE